MQCAGTILDTEIVILTSVLISELILMKMMNLICHWLIVIMMILVYILGFIVLALFLLAKMMNLMML